LKLKKNISLMNMSVKLCESCYLIITENLLENTEEKNAKKFQAQMREVARKDPDSMPFSGLSKKQMSVPPTSAGGADKAHKLRLLDKELYNGTSSEVESMASRKNKDFGAKTDDNFFSSGSAFASGNKHSKSTAGSGFNFPDTRHQHVKSAFQVKREVLPEIAVTHADLYKPEQTLEADIVKDYFTRTTNPAEIKRFIPEQPIIKQMRSPYSNDIKIRLPHKENIEERIPGYNAPNMKSTMRFPTAQSKERLAPQPPAKKESSISMQPSKGRKYQRTNYTSMMDTIKDLRAYLGTDIGDL